MKKQVDLLKGKILPTIISLSMPLIASSFAVMAYQFIDMIFIGSLGTSAVAAVGLVNMFVWFGEGLGTIARLGGQVKIGHSLGQEDLNLASDYVKATYQIGLFVGLVYTIILFVFKDFLISLFNLDVSTISLTKSYLLAIGGTTLLTYYISITGSIFHATGNSKIPFYIKLVGIVTNIIFDPIFIFGFNMGIVGAALATILGKIFECILLYLVSKKEYIFYQSNLLKKYPKYLYNNIIKIGLPMSIEVTAFSLVSMTVSGLISKFGTAALAIQNIGSQIESLSWSAADGMSYAVNSFVAQNYGAKLYDRVKGVYSIVIKIGLLWGVFILTCLVCFPKPIISIFIHNKEAIAIGIAYLTIVGFSEPFMIVELITAGAFSGLGKTIPPLIIGLVFTLARIPVIMLTYRFNLGLNAVWLTISLSSVIKGTVAYIWYKNTLKRSLR